jgi:glycosyltransferase involved in cell wall biosynthesis
VKVLYLSPYPPTRDGIGNYTWALANAVKDSGAEIAIVVPRAGSDAPVEVIGALALAGHEYAHLRSVIRKFSPDIIHVQFAIAAFGTRTVALMRWLAILRRDVKVPIVVTLHEYSRESALLPLVGRVLHRYVASMCDQIIVHTSAAFSGVVGRCRQPINKVAIIPHPRAEPLVATSSTSDLRAKFGLADARVLLSFGFIHVDKGLDDLVRALGIIERTSPAVLDDVLLVVAGAVRRRRSVFRVFEALDRIHLVHVKALLRRYGLKRRVIMTEYVPAGDVAGWFHLADAAVLPYRRAEQSGVASLAQRFGTPVLASDVGGLAEQLAATSWMFPPAAPTQLAETLKRFLAAHPSERLEASSRRPDSDLASVVARTLDLYREANAESYRRAANVA